MKKNINAGRTQIVDQHGYSATFFGADSWTESSGDGIVNMATRSGDLDTSQFGIDEDRRPGMFFIIPEVDPAALVAAVGVIKVQLAEQVGDEVFTITANQLVAFAGK